MAQALATSLSCADRGFSTCAALPFFQSRAVGLGHCRVTPVRLSPPAPGWFPQLSASSALGEGHRLASVERIGRVAAPGLALRLVRVSLTESFAVGVGQCFAAVSSPTCRFPPGSEPFEATRSAEPLRPPFGVLGVGQNEEALAFMRRAHFLRRNELLFNSVAKSLQLGPHMVEVPKSKVSCDVLEEDQSRTYLDNKPSHVGPEMARISASKTLSGVAEGLAGVASTEEKNSAAQEAELEGSEIVPYRRPIQGLLLHPRHESGRRVAFPLSVSHGA